MKINTKNFIVFKKGKFTDYYKIDKIVGEGTIDFIDDWIGAYGQVYRCINKIDGAVRAVKTLTKSGLCDEEEHQRFISEVTLLSEMDHPNILKLYEIF